jgi:heme/copper-type cytochrome/quinol oxidase subunit 3
MTSTNYLFVTYLLAITFLMVQFFEYKELTFTMSDSVFCSLFFLLTGFHGMHVIVGTIFLVVMLERQEINSLNYSDIRYLGFGLAVIY